MNFLAHSRWHLGEEDFAVFCALSSRLDFDNYIHINQAEIARAMEMDCGKVNKAIKRLEALGILTGGPKSGVSPIFMLNPKVGWKGKARNHFTTLQTARKQGWNLIEGGKKQQFYLPL